LKREVEERGEREREREVRSNSDSLAFNWLTLE
jgi:hypothetical protein